jgi:hypothetical protein
MKSKSAQRECSDDQNGREEARNEVSNGCPARIQRWTAPRALKQDDVILLLIVLRLGAELDLNAEKALEFGQHVRLLVE